MKIYQIFNSFVLKGVEIYQLSNVSNVINKIHPDAFGIKFVKFEFVKENKNYDKSKY
jgi:hypothetical protein